MATELGRLASWAIGAWTRAAYSLIPAVDGASGLGFPALCDDDAEVEALIAFCGIRACRRERLLAPHVATEGRGVRRPARSGSCKDHTTDMVFAGEGPRAGLTRLPWVGRHGFAVHATLAVAAGWHPRALRRVAPASVGAADPAAGQAGCGIVLRRPTKKACTGVTGSRRSAPRWGTSIVHVMDRAADSYELLADWVAHGDRFIVRLTHDRVVADAGRLSAALAEVPTVCQRDVPLARPAPIATARSPIARGIQPARAASRRCESRAGGRAASPAGMPGPAQPVRHSSTSSSSKKSRRRRVLEPVRWWLATTEPIDTAAHLLRIVDGMRALADRGIFQSTQDRLRV